MHTGKPLRVAREMDYNILIMEHISVNGEKYVKASSIARELGYTSDYVGQLARAGKIDAKLVGRSWFVSERSIREHKQDRYRSTAQKSRESLQKALAAQKEATPFEPTLRGESNFYRKAVPVAQYELDEHDLVPPLAPKQKEQLRESEIEPEDDEMAPQMSEIKPETESEAEERTVSEDTLGAREVKIHIEDTFSRPSEAELEVLRRARELRHGEGRNEQISAEISENKLISSPFVQNERPVRFAPAVLAACMLALLGSTLLLGAEKRLTITADSSERTYAFNFATAIEAVEQLHK